MAFLTSFISCFTGSKMVVVASKGDGCPPASTKVKAAAAAVCEEAKSKESKAKKSPPIPMTYFPIGTRFSQL
ncbi:hypothetical protein DITRI_Ditri02bG0011800 [Diplodiscus trichospermus]